MGRGRLVRGALSGFLGAENTKKNRMSNFYFNSKWNL